MCYQSILLELQCSVVLKISIYKTLGSVFLLTYPFFSYRLCIACSYVVVVSSTSN